MKLPKSDRIKEPCENCQEKQIVQKRCHIETYHFILLTHSYLRISIAIYPNRLNNSVVIEKLQVLKSIIVKFDITCNKSLKMFCFCTKQRLKYKDNSE